MGTSFERFEEETRQLAMLVQREAPRSRQAERPQGRRLTVPAAFVQAWAFCRRADQGAARP